MTVFLCLWSAGSCGEKKCANVSFILGVSTLTDTSREQSASEFAGNFTIARGCFCQTDEKSYKDERFRCYSNGRIFGQCKMHIRQKCSEEKKLPFFLAYPIGNLTLITNMCLLRFLKTFFRSKKSKNFELL